MLIEFKVTNFRSFRETQTFSMVAGAFTQHLKTHTFDTKLPEVGRLLRSSAVYGPNAAGKTNILRILQFMQGFVLSSTATPPGSSLPYTPFRFSTDSRNAPSKFEVTFLQNGIRYEYGFSLDEKRIHDEWLIEYINPRGRELFKREYDNKTKTHKWKFSTFLKGKRALWSDSTRPEELFLSKVILNFNNQQLLPIFEWFQKRLVIIVGAATMNPTLTLNLMEQPNGKSRILPFIQEADPSIVDFTVSRESITPGAAFLPSASFVHQPAGQQLPSLVKISLSHRSDDAENSGIDLFEESSGLQILFRSAGAWLNVFDNAEVLLFDEIDTSLHTLLARYLIGLFNSTKTNKKNAQLIFTTHNISLLNQDLFRRDQIWFTEKNYDGLSTLYPLTDFHPRNDKSLEKDYMLGRYGALPILKNMGL